MRAAGEFMIKIIKRIFITLVIIVAVTGATVYISNDFIVVSQYELSYDKLPEAFDGYRIVHLTDLHSKEFGDGNDKLLKKVHKQDPDIIVLTGDMVNSTDTDFSVFLSFARNLTANYEVYYIVGNHEQSLRSGSLDELHSGLEEMGVRILDNERAVIERDGDSIDIYGLWFNLRYYSDRTNEYVQEDAETYYFGIDRMERLLGSNDRDRFSILLTHNPLYADTYMEWGADLTFSGHIHGGMIRLPFVGGIYSPERTFFPEYDAGVYDFGSQNLIVGRGIGNGNLGFRFLNCPEIVTVILSR